MAQLTIEVNPNQGELTERECFTLVHDALVKAGGMLRLMEEDLLNKAAELKWFKLTKTNRDYLLQMMVSHEKVLIEISKNDPRKVTFFTIESGGMIDEEKSDVFMIRKPSHLEKVIYRGACCQLLRFIGGSTQWEDITQVV